MATLCVSIAHAEPPPVVTSQTISPLKSVPEASLSPLRLDSIDLDRIEHRARTRRNVGIGLAIPGVAVLVLGAVLIGAGARDTRLVAGADEIAAGAVATAVGVVFTVPGAVLWVGGQDSLDTAAWRRQHTTR